MFLVFLLKQLLSSLAVIRGLIYPQISSEVFHRFLIRQEDIYLVTGEPRVRAHHHQGQGLVPAGDGGDDGGVVSPGDGGNIPVPSITVYPM